MIDKSHQDPIMMTAISSLSDQEIIRLMPHVIRRLEVVDTRLKNMEGHYESLTANQNVHSERIEAVAAKQEEFSTQLSAFLKSQESVATSLEKLHTRFDKVDEIIELSAKFSGFRDISKMIFTGIVFLIKWSTIFAIWAAAMFGFATALTSDFVHAHLPFLSK